MNLTLQHVIVFVLVAAAAVAAWRILTGRSVLRRRKNSAGDGCAGCGSASQHRRN